MMIVIIIMFCCEPDSEDISRSLEKQVRLFSSSLGLCRRRHLSPQERWHCRWAAQQLHTRGCHATLAVASPSHRTPGAVSPDYQIGNRIALARDNWLKHLKRASDHHSRGRSCRRVILSKGPDGQLSLPGCWDGNLDTLKRPLTSIQPSPFCCAWRSSPSVPTTASGVFALREAHASGPRPPQKPSALS